MARAGTWLAVALALAGVALVVVTSDGLPPSVATHFGRGGLANGWMPRAGYTGFAIAFHLLLPLALLAVTALVPPRLLSLPHRDHWLAPQRVAATRATLRAHGAAMAIASALFAMATHALILDANARVPARLDETLFVLVLVAFVVALLGCAIPLVLRFRNVPQRR